MAERRYHLPETRHVTSGFGLWDPARLIGGVAPLRWLALMLLSLHASVWLAGQPQAARAFMLLHFCLFLLWQPLVRRQTPLDFRLATSLLALAGLLVMLENAWVVSLWIALLAGLTGTCMAALGRRGRRLPLLLALAYLVSLLFGWVLPRGMGTMAYPLVAAAAQYGLPLLPLALLILPAPARPARATALDYVYGVFITLLLVLLALAVFAVTAASRSDYAWALAQSSLGMAALLVAIGWVWNPGGGAGLGLLASRYVLSVGLPFESFARRLANLAERTRDAETLVGEALAELEAELDWLRGGCWRTARAGGCFGVAEGHVYEFGFHGLTLTWFAGRPLTPELALHLRLVSQLIGYFQAAKAREAAQREHAYSQAIAETGAQVTHDVKNILQSMSALLAAAESRPGDDGALGGLLRRQLPQLAERLRQTLAHLRQPPLAERPDVAARDWWRALQERYAGDEVRFSAAAIGEAVQLPRALFDSVADNLLANALRKRRVRPGITIEARFVAEPLRLEVVDDGEPVPEAVARGLFVNSGSSEGGLGVGLYLAARQAERAGFRLSLEENRPERVRFLLAPV